MKRYGNLIEKIVSDENIELAIHDTLRSKRKRRHGFAVKQFETNRDSYVSNIKHAIESGEWRIHGYRTFNRCCNGKERYIDYNPSLFDAIIQHAIHNVIYPVLIGSCITDTVAGITDRGNQYGADRIRSFIRTFKGKPCYVLKMDIHHFYESIDIERLKQKIRRRIKDGMLMKLIDSIIDSHPNGLPIGNFMSQTFANYYLSGIDHAIKEKLGCKCYLRYCDDMVFISESKDYLKNILESVRNMLEDEGLSLKGNEQIFPIERSGHLDFMGFVFYRSHVRIRRRIERRMRRSSRLFNIHPDERHYRTVASYKGWTDYITEGNKLWYRIMGMPLSLMFRTSQMCSEEQDASIANV